MYELIQINQNDYYVDCPTKIGIVKINDNDVVLIDSGNDKDAAKKVLHILEENKWNLVAIYNTHSHADHIGGNKLLQDRTGCKVYANKIEAAYTNYPILEPTGLYGALPLNDLKHKFLMAQPSVAEEISESNLPQGMTVLPLSGHCPDMVGFLTKDKTAYIGDSIASAQTLEKYCIGYMWDPQTALKSLEYLKTVDAKVFVPSHAEMTNDIADIANKNIKAVNNVFDMILTLCDKPIPFEKLLKKVFDMYGINACVQQYALIGSTLRSYMTNLSNEGKITFEFSDNEMLWKKEKTL